MQKPLIEDIQAPKLRLSEFFDLTERVLGYIPNVISTSESTRGYTILFSKAAGTEKYVRPLREKLFIFDAGTFRNKAGQLQTIIAETTKAKGQNTPTAQDCQVVDAVLYTVQQAIGAGLDLLGDPNSARKHVGNRFEELIQALFNELRIANKKVVLKIPYDVGEQERIYSAETDLIVSPFETVKSNNTYIDEAEVVLSVKTTSKDRMGKIFIDKILLENFLEHPVKMVGIFLHDVQRKEARDVSFTLVSGLFMVYNKFLTQTDGMYYLDLPPVAEQEAYNELLKPFSKFILTDIWQLLNL